MGVIIFGVHLKSKGFFFWCREGEMATVNPFDLLGDDDAENPLELIASRQPKKVSASSGKPAIKQQTQQQNKPAAAQLPSKPLPPSRAGQLSLSQSLSLQVYRYVCERGRFYICLSLLIFVVRISIHFCEVYGLFDLFF